MPVLRRRLTTSAFLLLLAAFRLAAPALAQMDRYEAQAYFRQGKLQRTLEVLETHEQLDPELLLMKANCLQGLERFDDALKALSKLMEQFPGSRYSLDARRKQLELLDRLDDHEGLVAALEKALTTTRNPDSPYVRDLAQAHVKSGKPGRAVQVLEDHPTASNLRMLAAILTEHKLLESYITDREASAASDPDRARILGAVQLASEKWEDARRNLARAPQTEETLLMQVEAARAMKDRQAQQEHYLKLVQMAPAKGVYHEKLGELYLAAGEPDRARATWRNILASQGPSQESYAWLGRVFFSHQFVREARNLYTSARNQLANQDLFRLEIARCHVALGDPTAACVEYMRLAILSFEEARDALLELARTSDAAYEATRSVLIESVKAARSIPENYFLLSEVLRIRGFDPEINVLLDGLCDTFRHDSRQLLGFAREFSSSNRLEEALHILAFLEQNASFAELWETLLERAKLERRSGSHEAALATLQRLSAARPTEAMLMQGGALRAAILLEDLGSHAQAKAAYDALVRKHPASPHRSRWKLAAARAALGTLDYKAARKLLEELAVSSDAAVRHETAYRLGYLDRLEGKLEDAMGRFTSVTIDDTGSKVANDCLEAILFLTTRPLPEEEAPFLQRYFELEHFLDLGLLDRHDRLRDRIKPDQIPLLLQPDFLFLQARAQQAREQYPEAVQSLQLLLEQFPESDRTGPAHLALADLYEHHLKSMEKAEQSLKDYLLADPSSLRLEEIRQRLEQLKNPKS